MEGLKPYAGSFPLTLTNELKNQGGGTIRVFLTLLALICGAGCNNTPSAPTPPPPPPVADAPEVTCPAPVTVSALTSVGAAVTYAFPESRKGQGTVSVACTPPSGTTFPVGVTQAECVATDSLNRTGSCTFSVTVAGPPRLRRTRIMAFGDSLTEGRRYSATILTPSSTHLKPRIQRCWGNCCRHATPIKPSRFSTAACPASRRRGR